MITFHHLSRSGLEPKNPISGRYSQRRTEIVSTMKCPLRNGRDLEFDSQRPTPIPRHPPDFREIEQPTEFSSSSFYLETPNTNCRALGNPPSRVSFTHCYYVKMLPVQCGPTLFWRVDRTQGSVMGYLCITSSEIEGYFLRKLSPVLVVHSNDKYL